MEHSGNHEQQFKSELGDQHGYGQDYLRREFDRRLKANPRYSLRAFARHLGISPTTLSQVLSGKRRLSPSNAVKVSSVLGASGEERSALAREAGRRARPRNATPFMEADEELLELLSDGVSLPLLSLARLANSSDPAWLARKLRVDVKTVEKSLSALVARALLQVKEGRLVRSAFPITTASGANSALIQKHHIAAMGAAQKALSREDLDRRNFRTVTVPVNVERLPKAFEMTTKFLRRLSRFLEQGATSEVYMIGLQVFPISDESVKA